MSPRLAPRMSVITPVWNTNLSHLRAAIQSVQDQRYSNWELCLVDDGSTAGGVIDTLAAYAADDSRIRLRRRADTGGTVAASNEALAVSTGDFVAFLDHDDVLAPDALLEVALLLDEHPGADLVYTDEDKLGLAGTLFDPFHKPDWSPEYLLGCMYLGHLCVYRRALVASVGGLRPEVEGSQDWDLALRVSEVTDRIHHLPKILYHWRVAEGSTSGGAANKGYAIAAGRRALTEHFRRTGVRATCEELPTHPGWFRPRHQVEGEPLVSIIIPAGGGHRAVRDRKTDLIANCVSSVVKRTEYNNFEIVCVLDNSTSGQVRDSLKGLANHRIRFLEVPGEFNFSTKVNRGAAASRGSHLLLLNDDTEVIAPSWLSEMLSISQQDGIGAVGAKLYFEDGRVQHAGVTVTGGYPGHANYGAEGDSPGYFGNLILNGNFRAVTAACLMTPRHVFEEVGGFSAALPLNYGDVDYCLKLGRRRYRIVFAPAVELLHYETSTRKAIVTPPELAAFRQLWPGLEFADPFYSPRLVSNSLPGA